MTTPPSPLQHQGRTTSPLPEWAAPCAAPCEPPFPTHDGAGGGCPVPTSLASGPGAGLPASQHCSRPRGGPRGPGAGGLGGHCPHVHMPDQEGDHLCTSHACHIHTAHSSHHIHTPACTHHTRHIHTYYTQAPRRARVPHTQTTCTSQLMHTHTPPLEGCMSKKSEKRPGFKLRSK